MKLEGTLEELGRIRDLISGPPTVDTTSYLHTAYSLLLKLHTCPHHHLPILFGIYPTKQGQLESQLCSLIHSLLSTIRPIECFKVYEKIIVRLLSETQSLGDLQLFTITRIYCPHIAHVLIRHGKKVVSDERQRRSSITKCKDKKIVDHQEFGRLCGQVAPFVSMKESIALISVIVDILQFCQSDFLCQAVEDLVICTPHVHPMFPIAVKILSQFRWDMSRFDLIVNPRRVPVVKQHIPSEVMFNDAAMSGSVPNDNLLNYKERDDSVGSDCKKEENDMIRKTFKDNIEERSCDDVMAPPHKRPFIPSCTTMDLPSFCMDSPDEDE